MKMCGKLWCEVFGVHEMCYLFGIDVRKVNSSY